MDLVPGVGMVRKKEESEKTVGSNHQMGKYGRKTG